MERKDNSISCGEAREMDMVAYLSGLGFKPSKIRGNNHWYISPLRNEKTASFKINCKLNRWYDFGLGRGGNLVDFGILYHKCSLSDFLHSLQSINPVQLTTRILQDPSRSQNEHIEILHVKKLTHPALLQYLQARKIPMAIADRFCIEVHFTLNSRRNFATGFRNDLGGYELRNIFFKGSSSPKGITSILNHGRELAVFEGFIDFLSYIILNGPNQAEPLDYLILNSVAFFKSALPVMLDYKRIFLYLDNDAAGQNCSLSVSSYGNRFCDESLIYRSHKDLNDFLIGRGKLYRTTPKDHPQPP